MDTLNHFTTDPKYPHKINCGCLKLWSARCRERIDMLFLANVLSVPCSARTAAGRTPCIAAVQNHIHLTLYSVRVLSARATARRRDG